MAYIKLEDLQKYPIRIDHYDKENGNIDFVLGIESVIEYAESLPTADVEDVVKCEKCTHKIDYKGRVMCKRNAYMIDLEFEEEWVGLTATKNDHFCGYGERRAT